MANRIMIETIYDYSWREDQAYTQNQIPGFIDPLKLRFITAAEKNYRQQVIDALEWHLAEKLTLKGYNNG